MSEPTDVEKASALPALPADIAGETQVEPPAVTATPAEAELNVAPLADTASSVSIPSSEAQLKQPDARPRETGDGGGGSGAGGTGGGGSGNGWLDGLPIVAAHLSKAFSSGVFFMLVGALMLWSAYGTMGETHTSFTFVLVVVGVAILLYGTGTQSAGESVTGQLKVYVAGGAGVLAFLVGYGIVYKSPEIKAAFQVEKKYFRYVLTAADDGVSDLSNYAALADINGEQVPALRRGNYVEVYVPYFDKLLDTASPVNLRGELRLYRVHDAEKQVAIKQEPIDITIAPGAAFVVQDGSYDFPRYSGEMHRVSLRVVETLDSSATDQRELPKNVPAPPPVNGAAE